MKRIVGFLVLTLALSGCAGMLDSFKSTKSTATSDVYFDEFLDIPIPQAMKVDRKRTMVSVTSEGAKTGLVTVEGNVEKLSLTSAMVHNMAQQGWALRGMVRGNRIIEIFEKENRFAICYFYDQPVTVAMEMWVGQRLADGSMSPVAPIISGELKPGDPGYESIEPVPVQ